MHATASDRKPYIPHMKPYIPHMKPYSTIPRRRGKSVIGEGGQLRGTRLATLAKHGL